MGWQSDPVVSRAATQPKAPPAWANDPIVEPRAEQPNTWGQAVKNVAQAGAHAATGMLGSVAGNIAGLGTIAVNALNPMTSGAGGFDPVAVKAGVANALTYTPENTDTLSMNIAQAPGKVIGGASEYLKQKGDETGLPYAGAIAGGVPEALANALGARGAALSRGLKIPAGKMGNLAPEAIYKQVPNAAVVAAAAKAPSTDDLSRAATAAYKRADESGIAMKAQSFEKMKTALVDDLQKDGIDPTLHPKATAALKRIASEEGPVTLQKAETLRRVALDAQDTLEKSDARNAGKIVDALDDYIDNLSDSDLVSGQAKDAAALKEARALYTRKRKGEDIERLIERAKLAPSGFENGLRIEFRSLAKNDRRIRRFNKEERAAINRVAQGGPAEIALRLLGKAAPTGIVSGSLSVGLGGLLGGPVGAAVLPAAGYAARKGAEAMTSRNAELASALMRRGPQPTGGGGGVPARSGTSQSVSPPRGPAASSAARMPSARTAPAVQADIQELTKRVQFELANESASSPKVRASIAELLALQRELAATRANQ